ncbi:MAG: PEP-CTERM sorting domain-containing protein [Akkermansiaceae bacterium]
MNSTPSSISLLTSCLFLCATLEPQAATISALSITNNSSANEATTTGSNRLLEWQTSSNFTPVSTFGDQVSFSHQMQFYNGYHIPIGSSGAALTHNRDVIYDLAFTVEDPTNRGYTISVDSLLRGFSTALWLNGVSANAVIATGVTLSGRIDTNTGDALDTLGTQIEGLTVGSGSGVTANQSNTFVNSSGEITDSYAPGEFTGTRSFALRFTTAPTPTTNVFLQNGQAGQGSIRYGLNNTLTGLDPTGQSQPGDSYTDNNDLGHFITVTAEFNPQAVPEPSSTLMILGSLTLVIFRRKRS